MAISSISPSLVSQAHIPTFSQSICSAARFFVYAIRPGPYLVLELSLRITAIATYLSAMKPSPKAGDVVDRDAAAVKSINI